MSFSNINHLWGSLIVEELIRCGVDYFCVAPGSRSSPLTVSVARHKKARVVVHFDERGLAFYAMGFVSSSKSPAVLICTSGTAAANFFPAVIEASKKKVPLIVLTADRPPELRQTGAVQTIDQVGLFGKYVKAQYDLPCPDLAVRPEVILTTIDQAVYQASRLPGGVVHINCMFRDPLAPVKVKHDLSCYIRGISRWSNGREPYTTYTAAAQSLDIPGIERIMSQIKIAKSGIIAVGKIGAKDREHVLALSKKLGWPIFADATSGLRLGLKDERVISYFDQILLSAKWQKKLRPDCILHLGGRMTSKRFYVWVDMATPAHYIMVLNHPLRNDPLHKVTDRVEANVGDFCQTLSRTIKTATSNTNLKALQKANQSIGDILDNFFKSTDKLSEPAVARIISQQISEGHGLFLANSMPVRDVEMFADYKGKDVVVGGNRGASGIDGTIASACGFAQAVGKPTTLLIGDLAFLHDVNSLAMLSQCTVPIAVVVINNNGGGIFSFLPIAEYKDVFEKYYGTPHGACFEKAAGLFALDYAQPKSVKEFTRAYAQAVKGKKSIVIEVTTDRQENVRIHRKLQQTIISEAL